jgi:hypothetical protein
MELINVWFLLPEHLKRLWPLEVFLWGSIVQLYCVFNAELLLRLRNASCKVHRLCLVYKSAYKALCTFVLLECMWSASENFNFLIVEHVIKHVRLILSPCIGHPLHDLRLIISCDHSKKLLSHRNRARLLLKT